MVEAVSAWVRSAFYHLLLCYNGYDFNFLQLNLWTKWREQEKTRKSNKDTYEPSREDEENCGQERDKAKQLWRDVTLNMR